MAPDRIGFHGHIDYTMAAIATATGLTGIFLAWLFYFKPTEYPAKVSAFFGRLYKWAYNKFYIDEVYMFITHKIIFKRISAPFAWFDKRVVDATMEGIGNKTVDFSKLIKGVQSGKLQDYAFAFAGGVFVLVLVIMYMV